MYLSKLHLHGFKSFAQAMALDFAPGVTAIVGPNGCGKSNVVDAVRWVIGEQRARVLRSEKMENVIFNGTAKRRPLGMAEVMLTIENTRGVLPTEYAEVTLGRRLYRSGQSEYLLNGVKCRLQDIQDLFMDTGMGAGAYSVIELKMVDEILSENAHDRRRLFEEAAGITKYKLRRRQALGKLDSTQADLTRLGDLVDELDKRVRSLQRQAARAEQFRAYEQRLRHLELALAAAEYERLTAQQHKLRAELEALGERAAALQAEEEAAEATYADARQRLEREEQVLTERQEALADHLEAVRKHEADLRVARERVQAARRERERVDHERQTAEARRESLEAAQDRLADALADAEPDREAAEHALAAAREARDQTRQTADDAREALAALRRREAQADDARADAQRRLDRLTSRQEVLAHDLRTRQAQRTALDAEAEALAAQHSQADQAQATAAAAAERARTAAEQARTARDEQREGLDDARRRLQEIEREREAARAEGALLNSLVSSYEDFSDAVQHLAARHDWQPSTDTLMTVGDVLSVDAELRVALDAALGDLTACVVVATEAEAAAAMTLLQADDQGQATFVILDRLADAEPAPGSLAHHVRVADERYRPLAHALLGDAVLADTLGAMPPAPGRVVTPAGEWRDPRGLVHGGSPRTGTSPAVGRLDRREQLAAVRERLEALDAAAADHQAAVEAARAALQQRTAEADAARHRLAAAERASADAEKAAARRQAEAESFERRRAEFGQAIERLAAALAESEEQEAPLAAALAEHAEASTRLGDEREAAEDAFQEAEVDHRTALTRFNERNVAALQARNRVDTLRRDQARARDDLAALNERLSGLADARATLDRQVTEGEATATALGRTVERVQNARPSLDEALAAAQAARRETQERLAAIEATLRRLRLEREALLREENTHNVRLAEAETRLDDLLHNVREDYDVALGETPVERDAAFDVSEARAEVQALRQRIKKLGAVNALALESYQEEHERLTFLQAQQADLQSAEQTLLDTIDEINTTAAARFMETYEQIRTSFRRLFDELFGGDAQADLDLVDPDDPLESAIEIFAQPRGKRPSTIAQLSGGEKTLTATALLFAIYLVKPSPFCILDEVDAPLDDANIDRFMRLIRSFATDTQFILVTHNKGTMELADRMYGITMQEQGVSQLVGVAFDEALEMAG